MCIYIYVCVCVYKLYRYIIYISNAYITPRERETNIHLLRLKHLHRPKTSAIIWPKGSSAPSYRKMTCCSRFCPNSPMLQREDTSATPRLFAKKTGFKGVKPHANISSGHYHCSSIFIILTHTHTYIYIWSYMLIGSSRKWKSHTLQWFSHWKHDLQERWIFHIDVRFKRKPVWPNGMTPRKIHWKSKGIERPSANGLYGVDIFIKRLEDSYLLSILGGCHYIQVK